MRRAFRIGLWSLVLIVPAAVVFVPLPYYGVGPGPAREVAPLIRFDGFRRFDSGGRLVMTTIRFERLTTLTAVETWLDDAWQAVTAEELFGPGIDREEDERISTAQMTQSQIHATYVVLSRLTPYPEEHAPGALIDGTFATCPAEGVLFPGEVVAAIDGEPVDSSEEAGDLMAAVRPGEPMTFDIMSGDERRRVELARERCVEGEPRAFLGVGLIDPFPIDVDIESADVGGPSAGLMFALGLYDLLTPGDLTGGDTIAGTGSLLLDGTVAPIGSVEDKVLAAEAAGASVFLAPHENLEELRGIEVDGMEVVAVQTFEDALDALLAAGGEDDAEAMPLAA